MILVTTAGKVGSAAARLIAQRDVLVRVLVRHPEKAGDLAHAGVESSRAIWAPRGASTRRCGASRGWSSSPRRSSHRS